MQRRLHRNLIYDGVPLGGFRKRDIGGLDSSAAVAGKDLRVEPLPDGTPHERYPNVVWTGDAKNIRPAPGYRFINLKAEGEERFRVERIPGSPHPAQPNVIWRSDGWVPAEGYRWVDLVAAVAGEDLRVIPVQDGTPHEHYANVVWTGDGKLRAAPGYRFTNLTVEGEERFRVERIDSLASVGRGVEVSTDIEVEVADILDLAPGMTVTDVSLLDDEAHSLRPFIQGPHIILRGPEQAVETLGQQNGLKTVLATIQNQVGEKIVRPFYFWIENGKLTKYADDYLGGHAYAVIIGVSRYHSKDGLFPDLPQATSQARELGKVLESLGFQIKYFLDDEVRVDKKAIENYLFYELNPKLDPKRDRVIFYFGGHGTSVYDYGSSNKVGYLLPQDYDRQDIQNTAISMKTDVAGRYSSNLKAKHILFLIDACVAGAGFRSIPPNREEMDRFKKLATIRARTNEPGRTILTAGTDEQPAIDVNGGIFTKALIKGLKGEADLFSKGIVTVSELELLTYTEVNNYATSLGLTQIPKRIDIPEKRGEMIFLSGRR